MKERRRVKELLQPDGKLIGKRTGKKVREVEGSEEDARQLYEKLARLGKKDPIPTYYGDRVEIPRLGNVGFRRRSKSGPPTIDVDVNIEDLKDGVKFKFVERRST